MLSLSPELCGKIVQFTSHRRRDLLALCLTCKAFQREAESRIYSQLMFSEPQRTLAACGTVIENERLALHVRTFWFNQDTNSHAQLGREYWSVIQRALIAMSNLEVLLICDNTFSNSWVLDTPAIQFRLREAKLRFTWDAPLISFLERQGTLLTLHLYDPMEDITQHINASKLPSLRMYDGTLFVGLQFLPCPIAYLQLLIDTESGAALAVLPRFGALRKTLRGFNLLDIPEEMTLAALASVSRILPELRHMGLYPYPMTGRHEFHKYLMRMHYLHSIELDITRWNPTPHALGAQRALAAELQTFCPTITLVTFWIGTSRARWTYSTHWQSRVDTQLHPQHSNTWCMV